MQTLRTLFACTVVAIAVSLAACDGPRPSDAELIARFTANRARIETLVAMMQVDRTLTRVDDNSTDPADPATVGISPERIAEYRRLLDEIGFSQGFFYDPQSGGVAFLAWATGFTGSGAAKSVLYRPENPTPLVDDLDAYRPPEGQDHHILAYRHIEGQWYLQLDAD
jgi:hypothetical protein